MLSFALGAATGLAGIATGISWLVTVGTVFLGVGLLIAIRQSRRDESHPPASDDPPEDP
jgi:hypothetical protein